MPAQQPSAYSSPAPIRLVATDLDGTLLRHDKSVSERNRRALARAQENGILVVLVTGRPPRVVRRMAREAGISGLAVCLNGAVVYDLDHDRVISCTGMERSVISGLLKELRAELQEVSFSFELESGQLNEPEYLDACSQSSQPVGKLIVRCPHTESEELATVVQEIVRERARVHYSGAPFAELSAPVVDKAWAVESLCRTHGLEPSQVVVFGDMPNDLPLLQWAGYSVAVANAHPKVLAVADDVTLSNDEAGVAVWLEGLHRAGYGISFASFQRFDGKHNDSEEEAVGA